MIIPRFEFGPKRFILVYTSDENFTTKIDYIWSDLLMTHVSVPLEVGRILGRSNASQRCKI